MLALFLSEGIVVKLLCFMLNGDVGMLAAMVRCKVLLDCYLFGLGWFDGDVVAWLLFVVS